MQVTATRNHRRRKIPTTSITELIEVVHDA
jgi:hypothetical protein